MPTTTALAKLDEMRQTLSVIRTVDEAKQLRDQAEAMRIYASNSAVFGRNAELLHWNQNPG